MKVLKMFLVSVGLLVAWPVLFGILCGFVFFTMSIFNLGIPEGQDGEFILSVSFFVSSVVFVIVGCRSYMKKGEIRSENDG